MVGTTRDKNPGGTVSSGDQPQEYKLQPMKRVAKPEGKYNIVIEEVPLPEPGPGEVRIKAVSTLISAGSELGSRYRREHAVDHDRMGYSMAGVVDSVGEGVAHYEIGDRVIASAPHAEYVVRRAHETSPADLQNVFPMRDDVSFEQGAYHPLTRGAVTWVEIEEIQPGDTVVVVGQGLVGSLIMQAAKANGHGRVVAIDALDLRVQLAHDLGADIVIHAGKENPVASVLRLTNGLGAEVVVYAVGGPAGPKAFEQAQDMLAPGGLLHHIGINEDQPLPLYSGKIQRRRILGGYYGQTAGARSNHRAMDLLARGAVETERMTTHRFAFTQASEAFALLETRPGEAMGVILEWSTPGA